MQETTLYSANQFIMPYGLPYRLMFHSQENNRDHHHDFTELVIVLDGSAEHWIAGRHYPVSRGDVFVVRKGVSHCYRNSRRLRIANVMFDFEETQIDLLDLPEIAGFFALFESEPSVREQSDFKECHTLSPVQLAEVESLLNRFQYEFEGRKPGFRFVCRNAFFELLVYLARSYDKDGKKYSRRMIRLSRMVRFIEEHFQQDISRDEIMKAGEVSISVGSRIFQEFLHETPIGHLIRVRIDHASELLRRTDLPVSEIAFRCGFRDTNYFSLQFKKTTGLSPREFAGRHRN